MSETLEQRVLRIAKEMPEGFLWWQGCRHEAGITESEAIEFARRLIADQEPGAWSSRSKTGLLRGIREGKPTETDLAIAESDGDMMVYYYAAPAPAQDERDAKVAVSVWLPEVVDELMRAVKKFPTWPTDPLHAVAVLGEEFGELTKAALQLTYEPHKSTMKEFRTEAIQTAAMALRFIRSLDAYQFTRCEQHKQDAALKETGNGR